jgi:acyl-CoA synthetase (NDP forming)
MPGYLPDKDGEMRDANNAQLEDYVFNPRSVAVIGASSDSQKEMSGGFVGRLVQYGYKGKIYPINPNAEKILELKAYPSIESAPGNIDYTIVTVPAQVVPDVVRGCIKKGVKVIHIYTAGFSETGKERGIALQAELEEMVHGSKTRLIGPNCMGVYSPESGITFDTRFSKEAGLIGFVSQTGVGGRRLIYLANQRGLRFSKAISYGNALDLDGPDFLEYFIADSKTKFILIYLEGLKQGRRFFTALRHCTKTKPVVMLKGGLSKSGAGAVASHTASLAGSRQIWQALFKQTGVIPVESLEEAVEQMVALVNLPPIGGRGVGLVGRGGGLGVVATDMCEAYGLSVPEFAPSTKEKLAKITPAEAGSSVRNPVEIGLGKRGLSQYYTEGLKIVASDPQIDLIITFLNPEDYVHYGIGDWSGQVSKELIEVAKTLPKPFIVTFMPGRDVKVFSSIVEIQDKCQEAGVACFSSLDAAIKAAAKLITYYDFKRKS